MTLGKIVMKTPAAKPNMLLPRIEQKKLLFV
jgi:hypothetical protein